MTNHSRGICFLSSLLELRDDMLENKHWRAFQAMHCQLPREY